MKDLIRELLPHAPQMGLFVVPQVDAKKLRNAVEDYGAGLHPEEVLALYDATLMGSAKDGALFAADRFVFQNNNFETPQVIRYADLVHVEEQKKLIGGNKVRLEVNRGRATVALQIDFSGKPKAAPYIARFLHEAMIRGAAEEMDARRGEAVTTAPAEPYEEPPFPRPGVETDLEAVRAALDELQEQELLSAEDWHKLRRAVGLE